MKKKIQWSLYKYLYGNPVSFCLSVKKLSVEFVARRVFLAASKDKEPLARETATMETPRPYHRLSFLPCIAKKIEAIHFPLLGFPKETEGAPSQVETTIFSVCDS